MWGGDPAPNDVAALVEAVPNAAPDAHHLVFDEVGGPRRGLCLVHWSEAERDELVAGLATRWDFGFVNAVRDLNW